MLLSSTNHLLDASQTDSCQLGFCKFKGVQNLLEQHIPPTIPLDYDPQLETYHLPPVVYKLCFESEQSVVLYKRLDIWNSRELSIQFNNIRNENNVTQLENESNKNFLQYFIENGQYPPVEWVPIQTINIEAGSGQMNFSQYRNICLPTSYNQQMIYPNIISEQNIPHTFSEKQLFVIPERILNKNNNFSNTSNLNNIDKIDYIDFLNTENDISDEEVIGNEILEIPEHAMQGKNYMEAYIENKIQNIFNSQLTLNGGNSILEKGRMYIWAVDTECNFIFCPRKQHYFSPNRNLVNHLDLAYIKTGNSNLRTGTCGYLRIGGNIKWYCDNNIWIIDNDSSYCFLRKDGNTISNSNRIIWKYYINKLLRSLGVKTSDVLWLDLAISPKVNSFITRKIQMAYGMYLKSLPFHNSNNILKTDSYKLTNLLGSMDILSNILSAFGAQVYFITEGSINIRIIEANNLFHPGCMEANCINPYVQITLIVCNSYSDELCLKRSVKTSCLSKTQNPLWNETVTLHVSNQEMEVLDFLIFHKQLNENSYASPFARGYLRLDDVDFESLITPESEAKPRTVSFWVSLEHICINSYLKQMYGLSNTNIPIMGMKIEISWNSHIHPSNKSTFSPSYSVFRRKGKINQKQLL